MHFFTTANEISANVADFNENIVIRFLGYDNIIQFVLIIKIIVFMALFGFNVKGGYKWLLIVILVTYYL